VLRLIDSIARGYDDVSRIQRFSPRKRARGRNPMSNGQRLIDAGRMRRRQRMIDAASADAGRAPSRCVDTRSAGLRATV
jgi:hypothetical protein